MTPSARNQRVVQRRKVRRGAMIAYFAFVVIFIAIVVVEISYQVLVAPDDAAPTNVSCRPGIVGLMEAIDRARRVATETENAGEAAIGVYRSALLPEWAHIEAVRDACQERPEQLSTLETVEQLRFAEEAALRRASRQVTSLRKTARHLVDKHARSAGRGEPNDDRP